MYYREFWEAGFKIFSLYGATNGLCDCGREDCNAPFKHPTASNWQHTPHWSEDQIEVMEEGDEFLTGYGVLCSGLLVVDVDAKNGGVESYEKLLKDLPEIANAGCIVATGSGGGSKHLYFKASNELALVQAHPDYPGIDFKSSGYVVGPGSMHASGNLYELVVGGPEEITEAPQALLDLLKRESFKRSEYDGAVIDYDDKEIAKMVSCIRNDDCDYEHFIQIGMAIHAATDGTGFGLWDNWAANSSKYDYTQMHYKWKSFKAGGTGIGTLIHFAKQGGYVYENEVTFVSDLDFDFEAIDAELSNPDADPPDAPAIPFSLDGIDLKRPPGFVGDVVAWINSQSIKPREHLAVAAGLHAVGNAGGLRYMLDDGMTTTNTIFFCVAASGTGKEKIMQSVNAIHSKAGLMDATYGGIRSTKDLVDGLIEHQAALYNMDEVHAILNKVKNAKNSGANYLEDTIQQIIQVFSKTNSVYPVPGAVKREAMQKIAQKLASAIKAADKELPDTADRVTADEKIKKLETMLKDLSKGIVKPFLSMIGYTTPQDFDSVVSSKSARDGFLSRSFLIVERDDTPRRKKKYKPEPMPISLEMAIANLSDLELDSDRIAHTGERIVIPTEPQAKVMLREIQEWEEQEEVRQSGLSGLNAIITRTLEKVNRISLILSLHDGVRTVEHVRWAFAYVRATMQELIDQVLAEESEIEADATSGIKIKLLSKLDPETGATAAVLYQSVKKKGLTTKTVEALLDELADDGKIIRDGSGRVPKYLKL